MCASAMKGQHREQSTAPATEAINDPVVQHGHRPARRSRSDRVARRHPTVTADRRRCDRVDDARVRRAMARLYEGAER